MLTFCIELVGRLVKEVCMNSTGILVDIGSLLIGAMLTDE
jgi:hypothetical protein